jgi:hypothetical protein
LTGDCWSYSCRKAPRTQFVCPSTEEKCGEKEMEISTASACEEDKHVIWLDLHFPYKGASISPLHDLHQSAIQTYQTSPIFSLFSRLCISSSKVLISISNQPSTCVSTSRRSLLRPSQPLRPLPPSPPSLQPKLSQTSVS